MKIGICTTDFQGNTVEALFDKVKAYGFSQVQFSFASIGEEEVPKNIDQVLVKQILNAAENRQIEIVAINGTFNMISPNVSERVKGIERFEALAIACCSLNCEVLSICTGTKNPNSMWEWHPDNSSEQSWLELKETTKALIKVAEKHKVYLGVETEASNVVSSPELARRLMDEINSQYLKIILDCANLFHINMAKPENVRSVIKNAFDNFGNDIILAHGKDILASPGIEFTATGKGIVDFDYFLQLLGKYNYRGGMILHGIKDESDMPFCVDFIRNKILQNNM